MSARERTPRERWPNLKWYRRREIRRDRRTTRQLIRDGRDELATTQHRHSAKWLSW